MPSCLDLLCVEMTYKHYGNMVSLYLLLTLPKNINMESRVSSASGGRNVPYRQCMLAHWHGRLFPDEFVYLNPLPSTHEVKAYCSNIKWLINVEIHIFDRYSHIYILSKNQDCRVIPCINISRFLPKLLCSTQYLIYLKTTHEVFCVCQSLQYKLKTIVQWDKMD